MVFKLCFRIAITCIDRSVHSRCHTTQVRANRFDRVRWFQGLHALHPSVYNDPVFNALEMSPAEHNPHSHNGYIIVQSVLNKLLLLIVCQMLFIYFLSFALPLHSLQ